MLNIKIYWNGNTNNFNFSHFQIRKHFTQHFIQERATKKSKKSDLFPLQIIGNAYSLKIPLSKAYGEKAGTIYQ